jgi:predicted NBD/HSP70 family sugar kinase
MRLKTASDLAARAEEDPLVLNVLDRAARRLARALAGLIAATDPHSLVIGTADRRFSSILHDLLKRHLYTELIGLSGHDAQLVVADPVEDSALRGIAGLVIDRAFAGGANPPPCPPQALA